MVSLMYIGMTFWCAFSIGYVLESLELIKVRGWMSCSMASLVVLGGMGMKSTPADTLLVIIGSVVSLMVLRIPEYLLKCRYEFVFSK